MSFPSPSAPGGYPPPAGYVPPPLRRSGPGCLVYGLVTCFVVFVFFAVLIATGVYQLAKSPSGKKLFTNVKQAMNGAAQFGECAKKMQLVQAAVVRYHDHTGSYPSSLLALQPDYLTDPAALHCDMDANPDPKHVSFKYTRPAEGAPDTTPLLSVHWIYTLNTGEQSATTTDIDLVMLLNGHTIQTQTHLTKSAPGATRKGTIPPPPPPPPPSGR